jgi:predicted acylesterase/phospholipase RssA
MATPRGLTPLEAANEIRNANNGQVVLVLQGGGALGAYAASTRRCTMPASSLTG